MNDRGRFVEQSFWRGEGLHGRPELSDHTAASGWEMQRQRSWLELLLCRHPNSSSLRPDLMGSKWRKGRKKNKFKTRRENRLNHGGYITLSKWSNSLTEHTRFTQKPFFLYKWNINKLTRSEVSLTLSPFCRFFGLFFFLPWPRAGGNRLTGHRTGSENCCQLPRPFLLLCSLMASFNMRFPPHRPAGDTNNSVIGT